MVWRERERGRVPAPALFGSKGVPAVLVLRPAPNSRRLSPMRILGRVLISVGLVLAIASAVLLFQGDHVRVNGVPVAPYVGYWWVLLIAGVSLGVAGAGIARRSRRPADEHTSLLV